MHLRLGVDYLPLMQARAPSVGADEIAEIVQVKRGCRNRMSGYVHVKNLISISVKRELSTALEI